MQCHPSCLQCTGSGNNKCTLCPLNSNRITSPDSNGFCTCQTGFYENNQVNCLTCHPNCLTCNGPLSSNCLTCRSTDFREIVTGTCTCQIGYYEKNTPLCGKCHYTCVKCSGPAINQCTQCPLNTTTKRLDKTLTLGTCPCEPGYNDALDVICSPCNIRCLSCQQAFYDNCLSCTIDNLVQRYFDATNFKCPCNIGYYDTGDLFCSKCHYSCLTCDGLGDSNCLSCPLNSNRKDNSNPD